MWEMKKKKEEREIFSNLKSERFIKEKLMIIKDYYLRSSHFSRLNKVKH
jgi:hypothetical protein